MLLLFCNPVFIFDLSFSLYMLSKGKSVLISIFHIKVSCSFYNVSIIWVRESFFLFYLFIYFFILFYFYFFFL